MAVIQEASAWIGRVSGAGLARNLSLHYPPWLSYIAVCVLLFANVINLAAHIATMADALVLLIGGPIILYTGFGGPGPSWFRGYALAEIASWPRGLAKKLSNARAFYGSIAAATLFGLVLNLTRKTPIKALFWSAAISGCALDHHDPGHADDD